MSDTIGIKEAVQELGVSERTVRRWLASGALPSSLVATDSGKVREFSRLDVERLLEERRAPGKRKATQREPIHDERLLNELETLKRLIESQKAEIVDLRIQVNQLHGEVLKALPPPARPEEKPWWKSWWRR